MRRFESNQAGLFSDVAPQARVPADHPLRAIRVDADEALRRMSRLFKMYADGGRRSVPPETLLKRTLLAPPAMGVVRA
jgi:hypothetical protein